MPDITRIELLGGIRVFGGDSADRTPTSLKVRLLLAYLCVPAGVRRTRAHLAEVLWPDRSLEQSTNSLRTALSELRRTLGVDVVLDEQGEISLRHNAIDMDIDALDSDSIAGASISIDEFLAGYDHDQDAYRLWLEAHRDQLRGRCVEYALACAKQLQTDGDHAAAKAAILKAISIEPFSENLHRALIELYIATGERGLALAQFRTCREILRRELDVTPSPETILLADSISGPSAHSQSEVSARAERLPDPELLTSALTKSPASSLAVLPFINLGGDAEATAIVDGIVEDITIDLSKVPQLNITPRRTSMQFRGSTASLSELASTLNVRYVLEGSLRINSARLRLTVQLVDTATNQQLWAERYDRADSDIFDIQLDLAKQVVMALRPHLQLPELARRVERTTENFEAYHLYLRGRELNRGMTRRSIEMAREMFRKALELDPNYVKAMVGEAMAETSLVYQYNLGAEGFNRPKKICERALQLDPNLPDAWLALGWTEGTISIETKKCMHFFERALELDPEYAEAYYCIGVVTLVETGDLEKTIPFYFKAWELDPGDLLTATSLCRAMRTTGQSDQLELVEQTSLVIAKRRIGQNPNDFEASYTLAILLAMRGELGEARYWVKVATEIGKGDVRTAYFVGCAYVCLGETAAATTQFKHVLKSNSNRGRMMMFKNNPEFAEVRRDPEVRALIDAGMAESVSELNS